MTTKPFDPTKPVQTRDGRKARIICTNRKASSGTNRPVVALIEALTPLEGESLILYTSEGYFNLPGEPSGLDLINVLEKHETEVVFWCWPHELKTVYVARSFSTVQVGGQVLARKTVTFEKGEGL